VFAGISVFGLALYYGLCCLVMEEGVKLKLYKENLRTHFLMTGVAIFGISLTAFALWQLNCFSVQ
jgi:hypothetical protein